MNNLSDRNDIVTNPVSMTVAAEKEEKVNTAAKTKITALYCRLSQEDERLGESMSIQNQKEMLLNYAKENRFSNPVFYVDDGYTGTNFDRPGFQQMLSDMQNGKVSALITKDLSRLGRDSTMVGYYQKYVFPRLEVRYIAVNDNYDSANPNSTDNDMALFKNLFNEFYPLDTSRKIRAVNRMKGESGKTLTTMIPYGYVKDPDDSNHWIVDEDAAKVVKHIFALCMEGKGPHQIADILTKEKVLNPTAYKIEKGLPVGSVVKDSPYRWKQSTVVHILERKEYTGCTVAFKTYTNSLWDKRRRENTADKMVITPATHEAIIDEDTFNKVQQIRENRHRRTKSEERENIFSGLLYCYDCDGMMNSSRTGSGDKIQYIYECSTHHADISECKTHYIRESVLKELVWEHLKEVISFVYCHEPYFCDYMKRVSESVSKQELKSLKKQLSLAENRIAEIDRLYTKTYEDNANGKISDERFRMLSEGYDSEQAELKSKAIQLQKRIDTQEQNTENLDRFVSLVRSHIEDDGLNGYNLHELIQGIYIENCDVDNNADETIDDDDDGECILYSKKPKLSTSKKHRIRKIHIKYDFIGFIPVKSLMRYAEESEQAQGKEISA